MYRRPPNSPPFPYPPPFQSYTTDTPASVAHGCQTDKFPHVELVLPGGIEFRPIQHQLLTFEPHRLRTISHAFEIHEEALGGRTGARSEEHTSELQSRQYLVCRLLLEKKNHKSTHLDSFISIIPIALIRAYK